MGALSDDMRTELDHLPPHWRIHGKVETWLGRVIEIERDLEDMRARLLPPRQPDTLPATAGEGEV